jgi:hypothetical protein
MERASQGGAFFDPCETCRATIDALLPPEPKYQWLAPIDLSHADDITRARLKKLGWKEPEGTGV